MLKHIYLELGTEFSYSCFMMDLYINRRLTVAEERLTEAEVLERGSVVVVLAEPGAGKTRLLGEFGRIWGVQPIRASVFRHRTLSSTNNSLIIDALDEAAKIDQSAMDHVIVKAQESSNGRVIFASRLSEWADARTHFIRDCFGIAPIIVRIEPLTPEDQQDYFKAYFPDEDFGAFAEQVEKFELSPLLGNPQFLWLFAQSYIQSCRNFTSKTQIFDDAIYRLAIEGACAIHGKGRPPISEIVAVASEIMAKLLLAGSSGVSIREQLPDNDYPYLPELASGNVDAALLALDTRLFMPAGEPDRHEPVHRLVAEYCAAQYIARRLGDPQKPLSLRRILAVVAPNGAVRDELRGLLGWMASIGPERLQRAAIELDPYAVLANGDCSRLANASKRLLLRKLEAVATANPGFRRSDYWRRFSVGGFITEELADSVGRILRCHPVCSPLVDLLLELLLDSGGPLALVDDIRGIMLDSAASEHTRVMASRAAWRLSGTTIAEDLNALLEEATATSLRVAADLIERAGVSAFADDVIEALLRSFAGLYRRRKRSRDESKFMMSYYLKYVIDQLPPTRAGNHLDRLTEGLACTCQRYHFECECRIGISKVAGILLDHFFEKWTGLHDPDRIWQWLRNLWYESLGDAKRSAAISVLWSNGELRHQLHRRAFAGITELSEAREILARVKFDSHQHSGLALLEGDDRRMADYAFDADNPGLWAAFWSRPRPPTENSGPDLFRRHLRAQAAAKPAFAAAWAKRERSYRAIRVEELRGWERRNRRLRKRAARSTEEARAHLATNRHEVLHGNHWGWVRTFAALYLSDRDGLLKYTDDMSLVESALRNCLPLLQPHIPTLQQLANNDHLPVARVAFVSCWLQFNEHGNLDNVGRTVLTAVKVYSHQYSSMSDEDYVAFERELDRLLFPEQGDVERFARRFIEPGLSGPRAGHSHVWWLSTKEAFAHLRATLPMEWLNAYPTMPVSSRDTLFNLAVIGGDRSALRGLIGKRVADAAVMPPGESTEGAQHRLEDLRFWQLRRFFFEPADSDGWADLCNDPNVIFAIADKAGQFADAAEGWPSLSAEKIFKILDAFVEVWRAVHLPSSYGTGSPPEEQAYRFLTGIVWRIGQDTPETALPVIERLLEDARFSGFTYALLTLRAETSKKLALSSFSAPTPREVVSMLSASGIASVEDLRAFVVDELGWLQDELRAAETDPLATYYEGCKHVDENTARNRVVDSLRLRMTAMNMPVTIEHHMANSNRCDFTVSAMVDGRRRLLVVEAKGQWHPQVYTAAAAQLNERYASHQDAEKQGIYLVFWFGAQTKVAAKTQHTITTADQLRERIISAMPPELHGRVDVVVLDLAKRTQ